MPASTCWNPKCCRWCRPTPSFPSPRCSTRCSPASSAWRCTRSRKTGSMSGGAKSFIARGVRTPGVPSRTHLKSGITTETQRTMRREQLPPASLLGSLCAYVVEIGFFETTSRKLRCATLSRRHRFSRGRGRGPLEGRVVERRRRAFRNAMVLAPQRFVFPDPLIVEIDHQLAQAEQLDRVEVVRDHRGDPGRVPQVEQKALEIVAVLL